MICSDCHKDLDIDDKKIQGYLWQTSDGHVVFICPVCITKIIAAHMARKNILIALPSEIVQPAIRKIELD